MILFLDTNIVIYAVESHPTWGSVAQARITAAQAAGDTFMVSDLVRMECLVLPLRTGNAVVEAQFHVFFGEPDVAVVSVSPAVCMREARIRAKDNFKPMDSLQLAAAVEHGANIFLTADSRLNSFTDVTVEVLK